MQIEMTIKGLMVDPITNMPIVILRDKDGQKVLPMEAPATFLVSTTEAVVPEVPSSSFLAPNCVCSAIRWMLESAD